jgi:hypothetical protein
MPGRPGLAGGASAEAGDVAEVRGTAFASGAAPTAPPAPLAGLSLVLLPGSGSLLDGLDRLRVQSRESLTAYRTAIPGMRRLVEEALAALRTAGREGDVRMATVDAGGRFALPGVAAGAWILIAYRSVHVDRANRDPVKESGTFLPQPRLVGYDRVSMWLRALTVEPGRPVDVAITDRNVWFEGIEEKTAAREVVPNTGGRRRSAR